MATAAKVLRHHLRRSCRHLALRVPPPPAPSLVNFSSNILFHRGKLAGNPCRFSNCTQLLSNYLTHRTISWLSWKDSKENYKPEEESGGRSDESLELNPVEVSETAPEPLSVGSGAWSGVSEHVFDENAWYDYPIHAVISMLDGFHDFTGLPWWVVISASTLALRASILPVLVLQLKKMAKFGELLPRLPPPIPSLVSERSFREQYQMFQKKRKELGCPSYLWNFAFFTVQFPCFLLWMSSIRRMCLDYHPGFDSGGTLWFQNLADCPHGISSFTFPTLIAGLHYINVQISFQTIKIAKLQGILGLLAKYYKLYLDILSVPLFLVGFYLPQGSLVYWLTNSSFTLVQQLCLKNPIVRNQLGLPSMTDPLKNRVSKEKNMHNGIGASEIIIPIEAVSPEKLLAIALDVLAAGDQEKALMLFRKTIEKDPELVQALVAMGQILCSRKLFGEAAEYFERAIPKIREEEIGLLVISLFGAGVSRIWEGRNSDGIQHLKKIADLREPDSPTDKACYYKGLVMLGSTLFQVGEKSEAAKYLRIAATYDPGVNAYIKECEEG